MIPLTCYQLVAVLLFGVGLAGLLVRRNLFFSLVCLEVMLNAAGLHLAVTSRLQGSHAGTAAALFILLVAAAEAAVGLALLVRTVRARGDDDLEGMKDLSG